MVALSPRDYKGFSMLYYIINSPGSARHLIGGESLFVLNCWLGGGWNTGKIGVTGTIFMCEVVVIAAIVGS